MSRCSIGVNIRLVSGKILQHKFYAADQLKDFVLSCDITDEQKRELKKRRGGAIDSWVLTNQKRIIPQLYAAQRVSSSGKKQPPRMMSFAEYEKD